jgi:hypothetical protein
MTRSTASSSRQQSSHAEEHHQYRNLNLQKHILIHHKQFLV